MNSDTLRVDYISINAGCDDKIEIGFRFRRKVHLLGGQKSPNRELYSDMSHPATANPNPNPNPKPKPKPNPNPNSNTWKHDVSGTK